jgi:microcin C transport system permease protein
MIIYFIRRLLLILPTLFGISIVCFFLVNIIPGGPVEQAIQQMKFGGVKGGEVGSTKVSQITEEYSNYLKEYYGFDKPIYTRYFIWLIKLAKLDFGTSYYYEENVWTVLKEKFPVSITFGIFNLILVYAICVPLGILKAVKHGSLFDNITSGMVFAGYSIPGFAFGIVLIVFLGGGTFLNIFPIQGLTSDNFEELSFWGKILDYIHHIILPLASYLISHFAFLTMLMKNSLMDQLSQDYIKTAFAKGLSKKTVILKHALRNALIPIMTDLGSFVGLFFAGSILIETIFGLDGIGKLSYESLLNRDYPVALAIIVLSSFAVIIGNIISDFLYTMVDPRIDFK